MNKPRVIWTQNYSRLNCIHVWKFDHDWWALWNKSNKYEGFRRHSEPPAIMCKRCDGIRKIWK